ncbi:MAG: PHP domain-containing protein [Deltaproteobacteria bacterium]|nr:MAG: PHP domain-containing protein [Deltaproteobacteria bacterium]
MIDLHTHSLLSDGALIPAELVRRFEAAGYEAIAITDHVGPSNIDFIVPRIVKAAEALNGVQPVTVIPGAELTHVPPPLISSLAKKARELGAAIVVVHGETIVEPVPPGTNIAAIEAKVDILAHPGLITQEEVKLAKTNGVYLEISGRHGHSFTNGHVAALASKVGAPLVLNSDTHSPGDILPRELAEKIAVGSGLGETSLEILLDNSRHLVKKCLLAL